MTNLAAALEKDPEIAHLIGNVTFMGGALTVEGNADLVVDLLLYYPYHQY